MKSRLTITIEENILKKIDQFIDGQKIRNRSHAIEFLLDSYFAPHVTSAVILAGGNQPHFANKTLHMLENKPLILNIVEHLQKYGVNNFIICTNHNETGIEKMIRSKYQSLPNTTASPRFTFLYEKKALGTAGAIKSAALTIEGDSFLVWSGDVFATIDVSALLKFHLQQNAIITVSIKPRLTQTTYDNVLIEGHTVVDFKKSTPDQEVSLANAGIYVFNKNALKMIPDITPSSLERDVLPTLAKSQKLVAFPFQGLWLEMSVDESHLSLKKTPASAEV